MREWFQEETVCGETLHGLVVRHDKTGIEGFNHVTVDSSDVPAQNSFLLHPETALFCVHQTALLPNATGCMVSKQKN